MIQDLLLQQKPKLQAALHKSLFSLFLYMLVFVDFSS